MGGLGAVGVHQKASFVAQVADRALDDPAVFTQDRAMIGASAGDCVCDAPRAQHAPVLVEVIAAIGDESFGPVPWPAGAAPDMRDRVDQRDQLGDVVAVGCRCRPGK